MKEQFYYIKENDHEEYRNYCNIYNIEDTESQKSIMGFYLWKSFGCTLNYLYDE